MCAPNVLSAAEWEELSQLPQKRDAKISLVPRCSPACPASREQPSVSAPSHKDSVGRWSRRRPMASRAAEVPEIGNPQPAGPAGPAAGNQPRRPAGPVAGNRPRRADRPTARNPPRRPGRPTASNHNPTPTRPTARYQNRRAGRPTASNHTRSSTRPTARYGIGEGAARGVRGVAPPGPAPRTTGKLAEGQRTAQAIAWARRDLNPHVLSDTRT